MKRTTKTIAGLAAAAFLATASLAGAQIAAPNPDGSPPGAQEPHLTQANCGQVLQNIVRTQNAPSIVNNTNFQTLPGTPIVVAVPDGQTRCVKILFTGETACGLSQAPDLCYIRAMDNNTELDPQGGGFQAFASEDASPEAGAYEWVGRVGEGVHNLRIERRVGNNLTDFWLDDWTYDVTVAL
jgi:hypothetical protein